MEYEDAGNETEYFKEYTEYQEYEDYEYRPAERQEQFFSGQVCVSRLSLSEHLLRGCLTRLWSSRRLAVQRRVRRASRRCSERGR